MGKKQRQVVKDEYEEAYGPMQVIYIAENTYKRLRGEEKYGKWYEACSFGTSPTSVFCFKTTVPQSALEGSKFHPDRFEPDVVAERCERVSDKEIAQEAEKNKLKPVFVKKGQKVWIAIRGAGVISYEEHKILSIKKGKVLLDDGPDKAFDAATGKYLGELAFGFSYKLLSEQPKDYNPEEE